MKKKDKKLKKKTLFEKMELEYVKFKKRWLKSNTDEEIKSNQSGHSIRRR